MQWRAQTMENKTCSELIKDARRKVDLVKTSPSASGTELLLADSLISLIEALKAVNKSADSAMSNAIYSHIYNQ